MRKPPPIRPKVRNAGTRVSKAALLNLAATAVYVGSTQHKDTPSFAGAPSPRSGATHVGAGETPDCMLCPARWANAQPAATALLRQAIANGTFSRDGGATLPRRVWALDPADSRIVYEARRLSAPPNGYKAFPLTAEQIRNLDIKL